MLDGGGGGCYVRHGGFTACNKISITNTNNEHLYTENKDVLNLDTYLPQKLYQTPKVSECETSDIMVVCIIKYINIFFLL